MPDLYRVTFAFDGKGHGWSESLIFPFDSQTPGGVAALMNDVAAKRADMLGREYTLSVVRVSKIRTNLGVVVTRQVFLNEKGWAPTIKSVSNAGDAPDACVIYNAFDSTGGHRKQGFVGGPPDAIILNGGDLDPTIGGWNTRFAAWETATRALGVGWLENVAKPVVGVSNYVVANSGIVTITSDVGTWGAGPYNPKQQYVRVKGLNGGHSTLNGPLQVIPLSDTTCKTVKPRPCLPFTSDGFMTTYTYPFPFIGAVLQAPIKAGNHKRGRPLFISPGRRKALIRV